MRAHHHDGADVPGPLTPKSETTRGQAGRVKDHQNGRPDSAGIAPDCKASSTLRAKLALLGFGLHELSDGTYLASRWNCTRALPSLYAVQSFARLVGAA